MTLIKNDKIASQFNSSFYQLSEKIGEGGFGHVYLAKQINTGQAVAIKFLSISSDFDESKRARYIERFERETLLGSRLQHPSIVRLLDKGESGDLLFAVFEYVEGITLKQRLTESGALSAIEAADVMTQVLDALAHAHQQGVVHRDIKPANIMLSESGAKLHVKVLDFGIGTLVNEARVQDYKSITLTQETLGTPSYSSPEQLRGEPATIKTDLYVWGLVFIECLTGKPAMSGSNLASIFHKQLSQESVALPTAIVGHPLAALLRRVLQKKAHLRSVNATDLYHEIQQVNVANLVGALQTENDATRSEINVAVDNDATVINDNRITNTGLTERKQLTVLAICLNVRVIEGQEVDHEVIDTLHRDQKNQCLDSALRYGAFHVGTLGDTQLFYYGFPAVSDNDARLCARTALDLISDLNKRNALLKINQGIQLDIKVGMHSGLLTCYADAIPEGDTANVALQLARLADNEQILCSDSTQKMLQSYLEFTPLSHQPLGVSSTPTGLFNLVAERQVEAFGFLRSAQNNHQFIGRENELNVLIALQSEDNENKFAHVHGEAGIGKSRLIFELRNKSNQYTHFMAQCLPEHINNALYPILNVLKYKYSLESLTATDAINKLSAEIKSLADISLTDILPILCAWLGYVLPEEITPSALSPDLQKQLLFKTLIGLLNKPVNQQKNLIIFEDMHWADPTSLEFIHCLNQSEQYRSSGDLFISTSRQPLPEIFDNACYQSIALNKLSEQDSKDFINNLFDNQSVATQLMDAVVSRTDGIPLFIEELVDMLKQKELVQHLNGMTDFIDSDKVDQLPSSLRESLQQKLDSLVYSKETAQLAATIGREFDYDLLVASSNRSEAQVQTDLDELINNDLILQKRRVSGDSYLFKHALVRDAAYDGMSRNNAIKNHLNVANSFESAVSNGIKINTVVIARHFSLAEVFDKAIEFGLLSSQSMIEQSASAESVTQSTQILTWIRRLPKDQQVDYELQVNSMLTTAHMQISGWAAEEVKYYTDSSINLLKERGIDYRQSGKLNSDFITHLWWKLIYGLVVGVRDGLEPVEAELEEFIEHASNSDKAAAWSILGYFRYTGGDCEGGKTAMLAATEIDFSGHDSEHLSKYGWNSNIFAMSALGRVYWDLGEMDLALKYSDMALEKARSIKHIPTIAISLMYSAIVNQYLNNKDETLLLSDELVSLSKENELSIYEAYGGLIHSWANDDLSKDELYRNILQANYSKHAVPYFSSLIADIYIANNEPERAIQRIEECILICNEIGEYYYLPQLHVRLANCRLKYRSNEEKLALDDLQYGLKVAEKSGAKHIIKLINNDITSILTKIKDKI